MPVAQPLNMNKDDNTAHNKPNFLFTKNPPRILFNLFKLFNSWIIHRHDIQTYASKNQLLIA